MYDIYLWSTNTNPWQEALPWQFKNGWQVIGAVTNYVITGVNVNILRPIRNLYASVTDYVIGSTGIGLYKGWGLLCESASYLITASETIFTRLINLLASVTVYSITGVNVTFTKLISLVTESVAYLITGIDVTFNKTLNFLLSVGEYTITGIDATFNRLINIITSVTAYTITGIDINLLRPIRNMAVGVATYLITTIPVTFKGKGSWLWTNLSKITSIFSNKSKNSSTWTNKE
jgi:hypothetical protein